MVKKCNQFLLFLFHKMILQVGNEALFLLSLLVTGNEISSKMLTNLKIESFYLSPAKGKASFGATYILAKMTLFVLALSEGTKCGAALNKFFDLSSHWSKALPKRTIRPVSPFNVVNI